MRVRREIDVESYGQVVVSADGDDADIIGLETEAGEIQLNRPEANELFKALSETFRDLDEGHL